MFFHPEAHARLALSVVLFPLPPVFRQFLYFSKTILSASALSCMLAGLLSQSSANSITVLHALSRRALMILWPTLDISDRVDHLSWPTPPGKHSMEETELFCSQSTSIAHIEQLPLLPSYRRNLKWVLYLFLINLCLPSLICLASFVSSGLFLQCFSGHWSKAKWSPVVLPFQVPFMQWGLHLVSAVWPWSCLPDSHPELASVSGRNAYGELHWAQPVWKCLIYLDDPLR